LDFDKILISHEYFSDVMIEKIFFENSEELKLIELEGANHELEVNGDCSLGARIFGDWFEDGDVTEEELVLVQKLAKASEDKNLWGTEKELSEKLRRKKR
jgi:hypothetical protein